VHRLLLLGSTMVESLDSFLVENNLTLLLLLALFSSGVLEARGSAYPTCVDCT